MHEIGIAKEMLELALEKANGKKIKSMLIELAEDGHTTPESLKEAFSLVAKGTIAENASLQIVKIKDFDSRLLELQVEE
jgi:hydrogenase nickel incorporation protein HypA/HybF